MQLKFKHGISIQTTSLQEGVAVESINKCF